MTAIDDSHKPTRCRRYGQYFNMSDLPPAQLALFQRAATGGAEIEGTTYLNVDGFTYDELAELQKGLRRVGVLKPAENLK